MKLTKCNKGHYYNGEKFPSCPQCSHISTEKELRTEQSSIPTAIPNAHAMKQIQQTMQKTVGWVVCIKGNMLGESLPIREGENRIGRSTAMDIILLYENSVSREDHASIQYDSRQRTFTLCIKKQECYVAVNQKEISRDTLLSNRDRITIGECVLVFVPFCDKTFGWNE